MPKQEAWLPLVTIRESALPSPIGEPLCQSTGFTQCSDTGDGGGANGRQMHLTFLEHCGGPVFLPREEINVRY